MKNTNILLLLIALLGVSSLAVAKNRNDHNSNRFKQHKQYSDRNNDSRQRNHGNSYRNQNNYTKNHGNKHRYSDNRRHGNNHGNNNNYVFNSPYRDTHKSGYYNGHRNHGNNHHYYSNRHHNHNYISYYNRYYSNYKPYYQDQYRYRPLRGLGHYFNRVGYGYGHWHDNSWCVVNHPQAYYYNYYSNYPYQNGWAFGDGDFGISFYFD